MSHICSKRNTMLGRLVLLRASVDGAASIDCLECMLDSAATVAVYYDSCGSLWCVHCNINVGGNLCCSDVKPTTTEPMNTNSDFENQVERVRKCDRGEGWWYSILLEC